jgi:hypothetical protein
MSKVFSKDEAKKLEAYFRRVFKNPSIRVVPHIKKKDMGEVFIGEDFLGPIYKDTEDGETSWNFQMAVLELDLDEG